MVGGEVWAGCRLLKIWWCLGCVVVRMLILWDGCVPMLWDLANFGMPSGVEGQRFWRHGTIK